MLSESRPRAPRLRRVLRGPITTGSASEPRASPAVHVHGSCPVPPVRGIAGTTAAYAPQLHCIVGIAQAIGGGQSASNWVGHGWRDGFGSETVRPLVFRKNGLLVEYRKARAKGIGGARTMVSKQSLAACCFSCFAMFVLAPGQDQSDQPTGPIQRVYVEERTSATTGDSVHCDLQGSCFHHQSANSRAESVEVTKRCPSVLAVTDNRGTADYYLRISSASSTLYRRSGEVAYVFSSRFDASILAKDICAFAKQKAPVEMDSPITPKRK